MKKIFVFMIVIVFAIQLSACGVTTENKQSGTLHLQNTIDNSTTEIKVDADQAYFADGNVLAYHSNLSVEDMKNSLAESNPDYTFNVIDDKQILMMSKANYPYTLFSKNVVDDNNNPIDDIYVVVNESAAGNRNNDKICLPYHLTKKAFVSARMTDSIRSTVISTIPIIISLNYSPRRRFLRILPRFIRTAATT